MITHSYLSKADVLYRAEADGGKTESENALVREFRKHLPLTGMTMKIQLEMK